MKKIIALLCALLLLAVSCACADSTIVEFNNTIQLNGNLPNGYQFALESQEAFVLEGAASSGDPAAPALEIYIGFNDSYAGIESLDKLDEASLEFIRQGFSEEYDVTFSQFVTASGDTLLTVRENNNNFLDFYTICLGYEIELTLFPAEGQTLSDEQISQWTEFVRTLDILPVRG